MEKKKLSEDYNERLFEKPGLRSYFHNSRFRWFSSIIIKRGIRHSKIFELGCFDGRLLSHLPFRPDYYVGFDADWEGGLSNARRKFFDENLVFEKSTNFEDLKKLPDGSFELSVSMETMEHLPPEMVESYLEEISRITKNYFIVTVPNEKGVVFFFKHIAKAIFFGGTQQYSLVEFLNATFGRMDKIQQDDHKGFDYDRLIRQISKQFEIIKISAIPFTSLPRWAGFTIGIIAKKSD